MIATGTSAAVPPIEGLGTRRRGTTGVTAAEELPPAAGSRRRRDRRRDGPGVRAAGLRARSRSSKPVDRLLADEEPFAGEQVQSAFEAEGIAVITGSQMTAARRATAAPSSPRSTTAAAGSRRDPRGRRPSAGDGGLGLDAVGLGERAGKFSTSTTGCAPTASPAAGCTRSATATGVRCSRTWGSTRLASARRRHPRQADVVDIADHGIVPRVTFTDPQVCAVGLTERQAREQGIDVRVVSVRHRRGRRRLHDGQGRLGHEPARSRRVAQVIVGATFTGPGVQELLHSATIAIAGQVTLHRLWHAVPSFPTVSEVWLRLLEAYGL